MIICDVEGITDWLGEEMADNFIIQWQETELTWKTEAEEIEEP